MRRFDGAWSTWAIRARLILSVCLCITSNPERVAAKITTLNSLCFWTAREISIPPKHKVKARYVPSLAIRWICPEATKNRRSALSATRTKLTWNSSTLAWLMQAASTVHLSSLFGGSRRQARSRSVSFRHAITRSSPQPSQSRSEMAVCSLQPRSQPTADIQNACCAVGIRVNVGQLAVKAARSPTAPADCSPPPLPTHPAPAGSAARRWRPSCADWRIVRSR